MAKDVAAVFNLARSPPMLLCISAKLLPIFPNSASPIFDCISLITDPIFPNASSAGKPSDCACLDIRSFNP